MPARERSPRGSATRPAAGASARLRARPSQRRGRPTRDAVLPRGPGGAKARADQERYGYFEHGADVGVVGRGRTVAEAFAVAARATFAVMADLAAVRAGVAVRVAFDEPDPELALVTWLNGLLAEARARGLVLARFALRRDGAHWLGEAWGEPWRPEVERGVEVKGATLTMLSVRQVGEGWEARCVVDV